MSRGKRKFFKNVGKRSLAIALAAMVVGGGSSSGVLLGMTVQAEELADDMEALDTAETVIAEDTDDEDASYELSDSWISLDQTSFTYNGDEQKPTVTVNDGTKDLTLDTDYTVSYSSDLPVDAGSYTITVTGIGNYLGECTADYTIEKASQTLTVSPTSKTLVKTKTGTITAETSGDGSISYKSSNTSVATVSSKGVVTAKGTGTATITVSAGATANYKKASKTVKITVKLLSTPTLKAPANTSSGVKVTWNSVSGASKYQVLRKTASGSWKSLGYTTSTSYTDKTAKNGTQYSYSVRCVNGTTAISKYNTTGKTIVRLETPTFKSLTNIKKKTLKATWAKKSSVTGYQIRYATDSSFTKNSGTKTISGASSTSTTVTRRTIGKTYYVSVRTYKKVNGKYYYSAWSSKKKIKITK
ncbi:MAG: Ig-like domain-containing protein [Clostridiales bacterium]|nr:Ig-like domain-containing protein [Clostridiales bacterium]